MTNIIPTTITLAGVHAIVTHIFGINSDPNSGRFVRLFSSMFGAKVEVVVMVWNEMVLHGHVGEGHKFEYLLWSLMFLKSYNTEDVLGNSNRIATNTLRKWIWKSVEGISKIQVVSIREFIYIYFFIYLFLFLTTGYPVRLIGKIDL
jgi:hypothetical protein